MEYHRDISQCPPNLQSLFTYIINYNSESCHVSEDALLDRVTVNEQCGDCKRTPLLVALEYRKWNILPQLVDLQPDLCMRNCDGWTPLHIACHPPYEVPIAVLTLLIVPANIDLRTCSSICIWEVGKTALQIAFESRHAEAIDILLRHGADVTLPFHNGTNCLQFELEYGKKHDITEEFVKNFFERLRYDGVSLDLLLDHRDSRGWTSLHYAVDFCHLHLLPILLEYGADANIQSCTRRYTPLMLAIEQCVPCDAIDVLITNTDINLYDANFLTALYHAVQHSRSDVISLLKRQGADVNQGIPNSIYATTLHWYLLLITKRSGVSEAIFNALVSDQNVAIRDGDWNTPLHILIKCHPELFLTLCEQLYKLERGCPCTPTHVCTYCRTTQFVIYLHPLIGPACINISNGSMGTALDFLLAEKKWHLAYDLITRRGADPAGVKACRRCRRWAICNETPRHLFKVMVARFHAQKQVRLLAQLVMSKRWRRAEIILDLGFNSTERCPIGFSVLHWLAVWHTRIDIGDHIPTSIADRLITQDNVSMVTINGSKAVDMAVDGGKYTLANLIIRTGYRLQRPRLLKYLCMLAIRSSMADRSDDSYRALGLPKSLVEYVRQNHRSGLTG